MSGVTHELKTGPAYFAAVERGDKTFEVRKADRPFQTGDTLVLREYDLHSEAVLDDHRYTGKSLTRRIAWILMGGQFGIEPGYCVLALAPIIAGEALQTAQPKTQAGAR